MSLRPAIPGGIALLCDTAGQILEILSDPSGLADHFPPGGLFGCGLTPASLALSCSFLEEIRAKQAAFQWEFQIAAENGFDRTLYFNGCAVGDRLLLLGGAPNQPLQGSLDRHTSIQKELVNLTRPGPQETQFQEVELHRNYNELTGLNNELANTQRQLAKQNFDLEQVSQLQTASIRELQETRDALAQSEERLRLSLHCAGMGAWTWDVALKVLEADENAAALFGLPPGRFRKTIEEYTALVHVDDRERVQQEIRASTEHGAGTNTIFRVVWPDGTVRYLAARGQVYRSEAGRPLRLTGVCWDITERRQIEQRLRETSQNLVAAAKFRELLEAAPDGVVVADRDSKMILVNAQALTGC